MRRRQLLHVLILVALDAYDELDVFEARDRCSVRAGRECQQLLPLRIREFIQDDVPEPLNDLVLWTQWFHVPRHRLQQFEVQVLRAAYELLQFLGRVEEFEHWLVKQFVEASLKGVDLLFTLNEEEMLNIKVHELLTILLRHVDLVSVLLEVLRDLVAEVLVCYGEGACQDVLERCLLVVVQDVLETLPHVWLPLLEVLQVERLVEQDLVAG